MNKIGIVKILLFNDSRKVGIGLWLYISCHIFLFMGKLNVDQWMACIVMAITMIGGGTIADKWMAGKKVIVDDKNPA